MECSSARMLIELELDGALSASEFEDLEAHVLTCEACRHERAVLLALDRALAEESLVAAPKWMPNAVIGEITRSEAVGRIGEPIGVGVAVGAAAVAVAVALVRTVRWDVIAQLWRDLADSFQRALDPVVSPLTNMPGFLTTWSEEPGINGLVWALAAAVAAFLAISTLRLAKEPTVERV